MLRILLITYILGASLYSNILCRKKIVKELYLLEEGYPSWVVSDNESLIFSPAFLATDHNITKRSPLLGLSIIQHKQPLDRYEEMVIRKPKSSNRFAIDDELYVKGEIVKPQIGMEFAEFSDFIPDNVMIISGCCITAGLSIGGDKFIDADYIKHFIENDNVYLGDVGARFHEQNGKIFVHRVNPFFTQNPFVEGDEILYIDGEQTGSLENFAKNIIFSPPNRVVEFELLRNDELIESSVEVALLMGGGLLSDTFLENIGVWFEDDLFVANIHKGSAFAKSGLKNSYRLVSINGRDVKSEDEVKAFLSKQKITLPDKFNFLFRHKDYGDLSVELKTNRELLGGKSSGDPFSFGSSAIANRVGLTTGELKFEGNWNGSYIDRTDNGFYDIYNQIPLAEYLSY
jgi:hypothetical protein